jgi:hypothetical protein
MAFVGVRIGLPLASIDDSLLDGEAGVGMLALWFLCTPCFAVWLRSDTMALVGVVIGLPLTSTSD